MNEATLFTDRRMTVREVAEALVVSDDTILRAARELFPEAIQNGRPTYLDEAQVTAIKLKIERHHNLRSTAELPKTTLEKQLLIRQAMALQDEMIVELQGELAATVEQLAIAAPKAEIADRIASASGLKTLTEVGKINGIGPRKIIDLLLERGILYRRGKALLPQQEHIDCGRFVVREKTFTINETAHLHSQTLVTGKGEIWIAGKVCFTEAHA
jgi:phage antirepressor YoqD-like protein